MHVNVISVQRASSICTLIRLSVRSRTNHTSESHFDDWNLRSIEFLLISSQNPYLQHDCCRQLAGYKPAFLPFQRQIWDHTHFFVALNMYLVPASTYRTHYHYCNLGECNSNTLTATYHISIRRCRWKLLVLGFMLMPFSDPTTTTLSPETETWHPGTVWYHSSSQVPTVLVTNHCHCL